MNLPPTQQRFFDLLADGLAHPTAEFFPALWDDQSVNPAGAVQKHMSRLRTAIAEHNMKIETRGINGKTCYRLVKATTNQ